MISINGRISLSAGIVLAVFLVLTGLALDRAFRDSAMSARQDRLLGQVYLLIAAAEVDAAGQVTLPGSLSEARFALPGSGLYGYVTDANGKVVWRSASALGMDGVFRQTAAVGKQYFEEKSNAAGQSFLIQSMGVNWVTGKTSHALTFSVSEDRRQLDAQLARYRESLWSWLGAMAALLLVVQAAVLRWGLRPLRMVRKELTAIENGSKEHLEGVYPREIAGLTGHLNALLSNERAQQKRYRDALGDLAHSLKTPLAVMRGALSGKNSAAQLATTVAEETAKMDRIVDYQLQRAATSGPASRLAAPTPLRPVVERIVASLHKVHFDKQVEATIEVAATTQLRASEGDLLELLGNILDNAFKWCRKQVLIGSAMRGNQLVVTIEDDGPGIAPEQARRILERGVRADPNTPGHGIGLAVAQDIVTTYGGRISIRPRHPAGTTVEIVLPQLGDPNSRHS